MQNICYYFYFWKQLGKLILTIFARSVTSKAMIICSIPSQAIICVWKSHIWVFLLRIWFSSKGFCSCKSSRGVCLNTNKTFHFPFLNMSLEYIIDYFSSFALVVIITNAMSLLFLVFLVQQYFSKSKSMYFLDYNRKNVMKIWYLVLVFFHENYYLDLYLLL